MSRGQRRAQRATPEQSERALVALHISHAGACRRAAMLAAETGEVVGFDGPAGHKDSARAYLKDARFRRTMLEGQA